MDNGPAVGCDDFEQLFQSVSNWRRWPEQAKGRGALNGQTPARVSQACRCAVHGRVVPLSIPFNTRAGIDNSKPAIHHMTDLGDVEPPEPTAFKDFIGIDYHGKSVTHLDALSHIAFRDRLFGGAIASGSTTTAGAAVNDVTCLPPIVARGVLVDAPRAAGTEWLEPGTAVCETDLRRILDSLGVEIQEGDAVLLRTGQQARRRALGMWDSDAASAGWHVNAMSALHEWGICVLGADGDSDVRPSPVEGVSSPIHTLAITAMGVPLLDNMDLEGLSAACAELGSYSFTLVVAPLVVPGATGSPVTPVAIL